tara:strand:+ start:1474 stop:2001 length:528 start_codon:yes stop_codon:yes gene_type:complete
MDQPIVFNQILPEDKFNEVSNLFNFGEWRLSNVSDISKTNQYHSWELNETTGVRPSNLLYYDVAIYIKLIIKKFIRKEIECVRVHTNGQTFGQGAEFHKDFDTPDYYTFILFTSKDWDVQWGGEFVCRNDSNFWSVPYQSNGGVLIPSNWYHYGASPNVMTDRIRTSLAYSYQEV